MVERSIGILNIQFVGPNAGELAGYFDGLCEGAPTSFGDVLSGYGGNIRNVYVGSSQCLCTRSDIPNWVSCHRNFR